MRTLRRLLHVVALVGTLIVGIIAVALIVSQTQWFRDWLRRYIVRESRQYLNGELAIGRLGGNLLFGVNLRDVAVDLSGERIIAVKGIELDYSVFEIVSSGIVLDEIKLTEPVVRIERDQNGWNLGRLVKEERKEAEREGPRRPISMPSIKIEDASVTIRDGRPGGYKLPRRIEGLDVKAGFAYAPVHYTVDVDHVSFRAASPELTLRELTGKVAVRGDNVYIEQLTVRTAETTVTVDGVIEQYLKTPVLKLTTTGSVSLPEIGRVVPAAAGYPLHPAIDVKANGPAEHLTLDLDVRSEAGSVRGQMTADVKAPDRRFEGKIDVDRLNLAPILKDPAQRTDITGHARIDLRIPSNPATVPVVHRMAGTFTFGGPRVVAAGYEARNAHVSGSFEGRRITLDGRASAYGAAGTATGFIVLPAGRSAIAFDLRGHADHVNLRDLPGISGAPQLLTDMSVASYQVRGEGRTVSGSAALNRSTVEGATIADGMVADFTVTPQTVTYSARGLVTDVDLQRIGKALDVAALANPEFESRVGGQFDVKGAVDRAIARAGRGGRDASSVASTMKLDATGTITDSDLMGGRLPELAFETRLDRGALNIRANGRFASFDPARILRRENLAGDVTGTVNATINFSDLAAPITPENVSADGSITLASSTVGGLRLDSADVEGRYASQIGDVARLSISGPDVRADASGRLALDRAAASNLKYRIEAVNLAELGRLVEQNEIAGAALLEGTVTGNAASLTTSGALDGSNLSYQKSNALDLNSRYTVTVPNLGFENARVEATTDATFVSAFGFEISQLAATTTYDQQRLEFTTNIKERTRELDATGQVIFHPDHQEIHLPELAVRTQGIEWRTAPGSEAAVQYGRGRVEFQDVRLVSADQQLDVSGALALEGGQPSGAVDVHARNVDLQQIETLLLQDRGFSGRLTADATIAGSTSDPIIDGRLQVANGGFKAYRYESLDATIKYGGPRVQLDATLRQSPSESIVARGSVPMSLFQKGESGHITARGEDQIDLQVTSTQIGLGFVQAFTNQIANVTGTLQADVQVSGSGQDPHFAGSVDIQNGAFGVPLGGVSYSGLNTRIELEPDRVRLQEFRILDERGAPLSVSGELAVHERQVGDINVTLASDNFEIIDNQLGDVGVDVQLRITGELRRPRIIGDVRLEAARLEVDRILQQFHDPYSVEALPDVVSAERTVEGSGSAREATQQALERAEVSAAPPGAGRAAADTPPAPGGAFEPVALDVRVRIPDNLVLRGKDLRPGGPMGAAIGDVNITVGGDVRVRKEAGGRVTLAGVVETIRGTYEFQGRRFDLVRGGTLRLVGTPEINPIIDVRATRQIPQTGVEARVRLTGNARTPELTLSSNPPLEESDILSLIIFNRPVNELGTGERSSLAATAGGIATGFLAAPLGESIGRALDLDLFEITTTTETGELGAGITLGQQIADRAFVKLRQEFGARDVTEFMLEYQLVHFLRLQTTASPETSGSGNRLNQRRVERAGVDLIFFFSY